MRRCQTDGQCNPAIGDDRTIQRQGLKGLKSFGIVHLIILTRGIVLIALGL